MKLQVAEEKRLKAVHSVRQYMVKSGVAEKEEEDMEGGEETHVLPTPNHESMK